jgi:hypothetical protein
MRGTLLRGGIVGVVILLAVSGCAQAPAPPKTLQDRLDAAIPVGSQYVSMGGELLPGDDGGPMTTGSGLPSGRFRVTLACRGAASVDISIRLPGETTNTYSVLCGGERRVSMTQLTGGQIGFQVKAAGSHTRKIDYYAGILRVEGPAV